MAALQIESLKNSTTVNELREAAKSFSSDIDNIYSSTWRRIEAQSEKNFLLAKQAIIWLTYAFRPLRIIELQHALAVQPNTTSFDDDDVATEETIVSVCCGLIVVDGESQTVRLVREYISSYCRLQQLTLRGKTRLHSISSENLLAVYALCQTHYLLQVVFRIYRHANLRRARYQAMKN